MTEEFKQLDEKECLEKAQTHRTELGYIHKALINKDRLEIILIDQVMTALYHENVKNNIIYIDATGSVTDKIKRLNRILYYAVVIRHPYGKTPPLPICEFISSSHDQYAIGTFLRAIHEKEFEKYKHTTNPRLILMDFSWAIILACVREFCGENIIDYVNRTKRIVEGNGSEVDISKSLLHICAADIMKAAKTNILTKYCATLTKHSQVHFAMLSMGRLINCRIFSEAVKIVK